jgi:hypothetical protein
MQTKLTLRLDDELIERAKSYAARAGKSVSEMVADYFRLLTVRSSQSVMPSAPVTESLRGLLRGAKGDEADYRRHVEKKHR